MRHLVSQLDAAVQLDCSHTLVARQESVRDPTTMARARSHHYRIRFAARRGGG